MRGRYPREIECGIEPSEGRPVLQFSLRSLFLVTFAVALVLGLWKWYVQSCGPPPGATVQTIEAKYAKQLARLRDVALGTATLASNDPTNMKLFAPDEILSAGFGSVSEGSSEPSTIAMIKREPAPGWVSRRTTLRFSPGIDGPVTYLCDDRRTDGSPRQVVVYENMIAAPSGQTPILYRIEFDLARLQSAGTKEDKANNKRRRDAGQSTGAPTKKPK